MKTYQQKETEKINQINRRKIRKSGAVKAKWKSVCWRREGAIASLAPESA